MELGRDVQIRMAGQLNEQSSREALPSLLIQVPSLAIAGFDCVGRDTTACSLSLDDQNRDSTVICIPAPATPPPAAPVPAYDDTQIPYALSLTMPASPSGFHLSQFRTASSVRRDEARVAAAEATPAGLLKQTRFHSQPILHASQLLSEGPRRAYTTRDKRFDPFKTFSGRLERQLSNLRGHPIDLHSPGSNISGSNLLTRTLSIGLSGIATVTVAGLLVTTIFHAFVLRDLFPNDVSIAITRRKPKFSKILAHFRSSSSGMKDLVLSVSKSSSSDSDSTTETDPSVTKRKAEP